MRVGCYKHCHLLLLQACGCVILCNMKQVKDFEVPTTMYVNYIAHSTVQQILTTVVLVYLGVANRLQLIPYRFIQGIMCD